MLLRSEQFAAASSQRVPGRVELLGVVEYRQWTVGSETHLRIQLHARTGEVTSDAEGTLRIAATALKATGK